MTDYVGRCPPLRCPQGRSDLPTGVPASLVSEGEPLGSRAQRPLNSCGRPPAGSSVQVRGPRAVLGASGAHGRLPAGLSLPLCWPPCGDRGPSQGPLRKEEQEDPSPSLSITRRHQLSRMQGGPSPRLPPASAQWTWLPQPHDGRVLCPVPLPFVLYCSAPTSRPHNPVLNDRCHEHKTRWRLRRVHAGVGHHVGLGHGAPAFQLWLVKRDAPARGCTSQQEPGVGLWCRPTWCPSQGPEPSLTPAAGRAGAAAQGRAAGPGLRVRLDPPPTHEKGSQ